MRRLLVVLALVLALPVWAADAPRKVTTVEGVTEYRLQNGLRLLLVPDASADTVTARRSPSLCYAFRPRWASLPTHFTIG